MRILVLTPTFLPVIGGAELVLYEVFRRLGERHDIRILTPQLPEELIEKYARKAEDYRFDFPIVRYVDKWTLMKIRVHRISGGVFPPFSLSAVAALREQVKSFNPDVINVHYTMPTGLAGFVANNVWHVPTVLTLNGRDVPGPGVPWFWKYWHRFISRGCSDITYVSDYCRDVVFGPNGPGTITWNGVDHERITGGNPRPIVERFGLDGKKVLFSLQRLSKEKGVDLVLRAFSIAAQREPDAVLLLAGTGPEQDSLRALASELNISRKVVFCGFVGEDDLKDYFAAADVFVFNTLYETFGIVLAQAMANGVPIVSVLNTAVPGVVKDGGILVEEGNALAFAQAALDLLGSAQKRKQLGSQGRARATQLFDWNIIYRKYESVFENAVKDKT